MDMQNRKTEYLKGYDFGLSRRFSIMYLSFWSAVLVVRVSIFLLLMRGIRPGIFVNGFHIHHFIIGFSLALLTVILEALIGLPMELSAILFGISLGLIADEFIYWARRSFIYWSFYNFVGTLLIGSLLLAVYIWFLRKEIQTESNRNQYRNLVPLIINPAIEDESLVPELSIVIPAFNESLFIAKTLESLSRQSFKNFELIVVDNNSSDNTAEVARLFGAKVITEKKQGVAFARQTGFEVARGKIIATTDADTVLPENWTAEILKKFKQDENLVAFGGLYKLHSGPLSARLIFPDFAFLFWLLDKKLVKSWSLPGANMAVCRKAFFAAGGFDTDINVGEDADLSRRLSRFGRVVLDRNFLVSTSGRRYSKGFILGVSAYFKKYAAIRRLDNKRAVLSNERNTRRPSKISLLWPLLPAFILIFMFFAENQAFAKTTVFTKNKMHQLIQTGADLKIRGDNFYHAHDWDMDGGKAKVTNKKASPGIR